MNSPTRIEVDAAIEALEGRVERRILSLEKKIDDLIARMDARYLHLEERMSRFEERMARFEQRLTRVESDCRETRNIASTIKLTVITTAIASLIAIMIGFGAITGSMQTSMLSAFSSGKENAMREERAAALYARNIALLEQMELRAARTEAMLQKIEQQLGAMPLNGKDRPKFRRQG